jgi:hypothetical protein
MVDRYLWTKLKRQATEEEVDNEIERLDIIGDWFRIVNGYRELDDADDCNLDPEEEQLECESMKLYQALARPDSGFKELKDGSIAFSLDVASVLPNLSKDRIDQINAYYAAPHKEHLLGFCLNVCLRYDQGEMRSAHEALYLFRRAITFESLNWFNQEINIGSTASGNLTTGRLKGAASQKDQAERNDKLILKINEDLLHHPDTARWKLEQRAAYIADQCSRQKITKVNGEPYTTKTIKKKITGKG